jgi:NAD(P) transhydrogenase
VLPGHHGAIQAAKFGKKIAVVESSIALGRASINTGTIPSKTLQEAVLRSTRSGSTDRRISASNLAQRIEVVASNPVRVFEIRLRLDDGNTRVETAALQKRFRPRLMAKKNLLDFQPEDFDLSTRGPRKENT